MPLGWANTVSAPSSRPGLSIIPGTFIIPGQRDDGAVSSSTLIWGKSPLSNNSLINGRAKSRIAVAALALISAASKAKLFWGASTDSIFSGEPAILPECGNEAGHWIGKMRFWRGTLKRIINDLLILETAWKKLHPPHWAWTWWNPRVKRQRL